MKKKYSENKFAIIKYFIIYILVGIIDLKMYGMMSSNYTLNLSWIIFTFHSFILFYEKQPYTTLHYTTHPTLLYIIHIINKIIKYIYYTYRVV